MNSSDTYPSDYLDSSNALKLNYSKILLDKMSMSYSKRQANMLNLSLTKLNQSISIQSDEQFKYKTLSIPEMIERKDLTHLNEKCRGVQKLAKLWCTDLKSGINTNSILDRIAQFGYNKLARNEPATFLSFVKEGLKDKIIILLCLAALLSIILGMALPNPHTQQWEWQTGWIEGTAIIITVCIVILTGSIQNYQKAKKFEELEIATRTKFVTVVRDGIEIIIDTEDLCVGDVMLIEGGMQLDCDGVLIDGVHLKCNESSMTGETNAIKKSITVDPFFLSGTLIEEGQGTMLVVAIGAQSFQGKLKQSIEKSTSETPLEAHLTLLADKIGYAGMLAAVTLFIGLVIKEVIYVALGTRILSVSTILQFFIIAVTVVVVAVPEGLPLAVTISLAFSMKSMLKSNCLVRILASCETMGAATTVASDKTGTLTTNTMTVVQGVICQSEFVLVNKGVSAYDAGSAAPVKAAAPLRPQLRVSEANFAEFGVGLALNTTAKKHSVNGRPVWLGNRTEQGLLGFVDACGVDVAGCRGLVPERHRRQLPFSSARKTMATLVRGDGAVLRALARGAPPDAALFDTDSALVFLKGAGEVVLAQCQQHRTDAGDCALTPEARAHYAAALAHMAAQGSRVIGVAVGCARMPTLPEDDPVGVPYTYLGLIGMQDPIRSTVPEAVRTCALAGVSVRMITGDHPETAIAIAKKCGIYEDNGFDSVLQGKELREWHDRAIDNPQVEEELLSFIPRLKILARSTPSDKYILVGLLQKIGDVVSVTGDGTNDAPALKLADVGFAMNSGTDIAKGSSDIVLLDDEFSTVIKAMSWGRTVNDNIRKFIQFQLSINVGGVFLTLIGSLASSTNKEPFSPVMLLWLNLIMDTLAALALATETPEDASLSRPPVYKQASLINSKMTLFIFSHAIFQASIILVLLFTGHSLFQTIENPSVCAQASQYTNSSNQTTTNAFISCMNVCRNVGGHFDNTTRICHQGETHTSILFNSYIWLQIFNILNARKLYTEWNPLEGITTRSKFLVFVFIIVILVQVFFIEVLGPYTNFVAVTSLTGFQWLITVAIGISELPFGIIPRLIPIKAHVPALIQDKIKKEQELRDKYLKIKY